MSLCSVVFTAPLVPSGDTVPSGVSVAPCKSETLPRSHGRAFAPSGASRSHLLGDAALS